MSTISYPEERSVDSKSVSGEVKYYNHEREFGFITTSDGDMYFKPEGFRVRQRNRWGTSLVPRVCPPIQNGMDVTVFAYKDNVKGKVALSWGVDDQSIDPLYAVIERTEKSTEAQDLSARLWKIHTVVSERVVFIGCERDCRDICQHNPNKRVVVLNEQNGGHIRQ